MEPIRAERPLAREPPAHARMPYAVGPRLRRELIIYGIAVGCGLVLMPFAVWSIGSRMLGPYTHGDNPNAGPFALFADFWVGLWHGSAVFWLVALGPALAILVVRIFLALLRALPPPGPGRRA